MPPKVTMWPAAGINKVAVYVKPQEGMAYYVVNDTDTGSVTL